MRFAMELLQLYGGYERRPSLLEQGDVCKCMFDDCFFHPLLLCISQGVILSSDTPFTVAIGHIPHR